MNLILLTQQDFISPTRVRLFDRRFDHIVNILKSAVGDQLSVGLMNEKMGQGTVKHLTANCVELEVTLNVEPPEALPLTLIMPMIRPPMFKRTLFHATTLGIKSIHLLNFARVERSFWTSSSLRPEEIHEQLVLGLEQAKDTVMPHVYTHERFKPFVEDELPTISQNTQKIVAHPGGQVLSSSNSSQLTTLIIGPEGGLVHFELELLNQLNFVQFDLGKRILRVETALPVLIGRLFR